MTYWKLERPSKRSGKKWKVRVPTSSGRGKTVAFGDASMEDYTIHKDKSRRDDYRTRHQHDHIDNPYKPGYWSWWSLWGASSDLSKAHAVAVAKAKQILGVKRQDGIEVATSSRAHQLEARANPNPSGSPGSPGSPGVPSPTMAEVSGAVAALDVPKHLRAEFIQGFAVEWEHAHTVGYDVLLVGRIVLDHLAEDAHYYRKLRRARLNPQPTAPSERVRACFDTLLSMVREQYPDLVCALEVDERAGERGGESCARAYAYCEDLPDGSFRIAIASKMDDAEDSRVEGLLRHELAHAILLHGGDLEHTERDADEVAEALFGSPLYYDHEDVQTTDPSAPGARRSRPEYLDDENGRTRDTPALDAADPASYDRHVTASRNPSMPHQLETVEDVESCLDDCAARGDAKTPRMLASQFSQQAKEVAGAQARMLTSLAKACRHCANAIEARLAGNIEHAMSCERLCERAIGEAQSPSRKNPRKQKFAPGFAPDFLERVSASQESARRWEEEAPARETAAAAQAEAEKTWSKLSPAQKQKYRSDPRIWEHPFGAAGVAHDDAMGRTNPEWAKKLGRGLYKGARYAGETARDLYHGAREAHSAHDVPPADEGARKNPSSYSEKVMQRACDILQSSGRSAYYEYPGFISVGEWSFGEDLDDKGRSIIWGHTEEAGSSSEDLVLSGTDVDRDANDLVDLIKRAVGAGRSNPEWAKKLGKLAGAPRRAKERAAAAALAQRERAAKQAAESKAAWEAKKARAREYYAEVKRDFSEGLRSNPRLPGIGILTIRPDPEGARDQARVEVTKAFASEWDHDILNRAALSRDVMKAVEKHRHGSNFYAVELTYRGREFFKLFPRETED